MSSLERLEALRQKVLVEQKRQNKSGDSVWNIDGIPKSYLQKGHCSAALTSFQQFLMEFSHEQKLLNEFYQHDGNAEELATKLDREVAIPDYMRQNVEHLQGREAVRLVTVRSNQNVFRKMILEIYQSSCCITGLNIPTVNRASHIVPWAEDEAYRMNPANGLCLSATYDAAFDRYLISLDDDYRVILSSGIKEYATRQSVKDYFLNIEGQKIQLPQRFAPNKALLERHRKKAGF